MKLFGLGKNKKADSADSGDKKCFNCGKKIVGKGYTKSQGRYCCEKCCNNKNAGSGEKCEFC